MRIRKKQQKRILISVVATLVLLVIATSSVLSKRSKLLDKAVFKAQQQLYIDHQLNLEVAHYGFESINSVRFETLAVVPEGKDTLLTVDQLEIEVALWPLLFGTIKVADLQVMNAAVTLMKRDTLSNYEFLFNKNQEPQDTIANQPVKQRDFALWVEKTTKRIFSLVPDNMTVIGFSLSYQDSLFDQKVTVPELIVKKGQLSARLLLNDNTAEWIVEGELKASDQRFRLAVSSRDPDTELPFLKRKLGLAVSFDKLIFDLASIKQASQDLLQVNGSFECENLQVTHWRLSEEAIVLPYAKVDGGIDLSASYVALKKETRIKVNEFEIEPSFKITLTPHRKVELGVHTGYFKAQHFFDALPLGLFEMLKGVEVDGNISFDMDFAVELDQPDNIVFSAAIDDANLSLVKWGAAHIDSLQYPFIYDVYDDTVLVRSLLVGTENPKFKPLKEIPIVLKNTVRNTEDPLFYRHNGFDEEAFKMSISTNLKERKFKRGASTISMQLIKNLFLNRKKTMDRKLEEILLVWLMESSSDVSKDRILEIYLNVIEWGRGIYGIEEAAQYYFNKKSTELGLGESLFLASIIPRPKTGLSSFDYKGQLKPWLLGYFNTYGTRMQKVGDLNTIEVPEDYGFHDVKLKPSLRPKAPADSLLNEVNITPEFLKELL